MPQCKNTTIATPDKLFFFVPQDIKIRKKWFQIAKRSDEPAKSHYYCCEDHFNVLEKVFLFNAIKSNIT